MEIRDISKTGPANIILGKARQISIETDSGKTFTILERNGVLEIYSEMGTDISVHPSAANCVKIDQS